MQIHANLYESTGYKDELAFAAAMLYKVTGAEGPGQQLWRRALVTWQS